MTLEELAASAQAAIDTRARMRAQHGESFNSPAQMMLVLRRPEPRGNRVPKAAAREGRA